ncbi:hypothetical protein TNCV_4522171 [Trichonephila clavipes]|nr:hypothetical protein TNCV_4522171 [Trichonephila clavipes]
MTLHRLLIERNFSSYRPLRHLPLMPAYCPARLQWCLTRSDVSGDAQGSVPIMFSLLLSGLQPGIMVWGAISFDCQTPLVVIRGKLQHSGTSTTF